MDGSDGMEWLIDKNRPICPQISEQFCLRIAGGNYLPNERLPSVREIAVSAGVNPNTVQRSLEELERRSILYSVRGSGWFVGEDISLAKEVFQEILDKKTAEYFAAMEIMGMDASAVKEYVKEWKA